MDPEELEDDELEEIRSGCPDLFLSLLSLKRLVAAMRILRR